MRKLIFLCLLSLPFYFEGMAQQFTLLVGTYTKGKSTGIYTYDFQPGTGTATVIDSVKSSNPSYLAVTPENEFVYAVNEDGPNSGGGRVVAYAFDKETRKLRFINQESSMGNGPCYVSVDKSGKWVAAGNYSSGTVALYPIAPDGGIGAANITLQHQGKSVNPVRQQEPHVHATVFSPDNKYLLAPDLGIDKIVVYEFNSKKGMLESKVSLKATAGAGPRHIEFHPSGKWMYAIQELSGTVSAYKYNKGELQQVQEVSLLPEGFTGVATSADIHVSPDGRFLYASNRNPTNTITIFSIDQNTGQLTVAGHESTMGKTPRNFNFDPTGTYLLVANQDSDNITIFRVDKETGKLTYTGKEIQVPSPVCIKWIVDGKKKK